MGAISQKSFDDCISYSKYTRLRVHCHIPSFLELLVIHDCEVMHSHIQSIFIGIFDLMVRMGRRENSEMLDTAACCMLR